jgi:hypothetical protein
MRFADIFCISCCCADSTRGAGVSGIHKDSEIATLSESDILSNHADISDLYQLEALPPRNRSRTALMTGRRLVANSANSAREMPEASSWRAMAATGAVS